MAVSTGDSYEISFRSKIPKQISTGLILKREDIRVIEYKTKWNLKLFSAVQDKKKKKNNARKSKFVVFSALINPGLDVWH